MSGQLSIEEAIETSLDPEGARQQLLEGKRLILQEILAAEYAPPPVDLSWLAEANERIQRDFITAANLIVPHFQAVGQAFDATQQILEEHYKQLFGAAFLPILSCVDAEEEIFRRYAEHYNRFHPARRISWRRLSRPQMERAYELFG
jgi:hypothetical protein